MHLYFAYVFQKHNIKLVQIMLYFSTGRIADPIEYNFFVVNFMVYVAKIYNFRINSNKIIISLKKYFYKKLFRKMAFCNKRNFKIEF